MKYSSLDKEFGEEVGEINWTVTICSLIIQVNDLIHTINGKYYGFENSLK